MNHVTTPRPRYRPMAYAATPPRIQPAQSSRKVVSPPNASSATGVMIAVEKKTTIADSAESTTNRIAPAMA